MSHKEALTLAMNFIERTSSYLPTSFDSDGLKIHAMLKEALAQQELCKYGQETKSCTSNPMDCQCALDATFAQPEQDPDELTMSYLRGVHDGKKQRTWVGLTESEKYALSDDVSRRGVPIFEAICEAEAKLKEKNT